MAIFYLVRHGEADYSEMLEKGFYGFGRSFAPLSEKGINQAEMTAIDDRLKSAELIVSSPYTRALQTAISEPTAHTFTMNYIMTKVDMKSTCCYGHPKLFAI